MFMDCTENSLKIILLAFMSETIVLLIANLKRAKVHDCSFFIAMY